MKKKITDIWKFLTYDIWRITEDEVTRTKFSLYINPEKPDVPLNKNDAFQKVQKRRVQEKR